MFMMLLAALANFCLLFLVVTFDGLLTILPNLVDNQHHTFLTSLALLILVTPFFVLSQLMLVNGSTKVQLSFSVFCLLSAFFQLFMSASDVPGFFFLCGNIGLPFNLLCFW